MNKSTFYTYAFGCRVNEAEKEEIDRKMIARGMVYEPNNPFVYIINTCSVTHKAEREARQLVYTVKKDHPETKIVVTGCAATYWLKNDLHGDLPVDLTVDNLNKEFLVDIIERRLLEKNKSKHEENHKPTNKFMGSGRVMIKIQDGCQRFCTFCIVPYLRGMPKSYPEQDIVKNINKLERSMVVSEVVLTAINTQAYGYDNGQKFVNLVNAVIAKTKVPRVSFGSIHPWSVDDDFFAFYKKVLPLNRLVNFFHIPLQSGSNKILSLMKRGYKREEFVEKLGAINKINPNAFMATDVIVGFLEETDSDFEDTYNFLKASPINRFHVFRFSRRAKTAADYMARRMMEPTPKEKATRSEALIRLGQEKYEKFLMSQVGRYSTALLLEKETEGFREALLDNQLPVYVKIGKEDASAIKKVKIIEFKKGRLFGRID
jgi:threonylcarbamoyladenosine tRNA methylthiotransferase MtaB